MWLPEDIDAALDWMDWESSLCSGCGLPRHESFDPANWRRYEAEVLVCQGCRVKDRKAEVRRNNAGEGAADNAGVYIVVNDADDRDDE